MEDLILQQLSDALRSVGGLVALVLGGSRARGTAGPTSDYDLGLYYDPATPLDVGQLRATVLPLVDRPEEAVVTPIGEWGPWINGGAWLTISGRKVDLLYRDLDRVASVMSDCRAGRISMNYQPGHPHGFCSAIWMGEIALCRPLFDRTGILANLKAQTNPFPYALKEALIARFHWEVRFSIEIAQKAISRGEQTYFAGCVYRALCCVAQVLFAVNRRYLINEKGALAEAETFPVTIDQLGEVVHRIWAATGAGEFNDALELLQIIARRLDGILVEPCRGST